MKDGEIPWENLAQLRELADSDALEPHPEFLSADQFPLVYQINERILILDPSDYMAAMRISRVHLYWATVAETHDLAAYHKEQRYVWLAEALLRDPPPHLRKVIEGALGTTQRRPVATTRRAVDATRELALATLPMELIRLARSLREDEPRLPHLACIASHRAVAYADRQAGSGTDPKVAAERYSARTSLCASLRKMQRPTEAIDVAIEAIGLRSDDPVGWTTLIAATRDRHESAAAVAFVERALEELGRPKAEADGYFAMAAAAAYAEAGRPEATVWIEAALRSENVPKPSRRDVLAHARRVVDVLRKRGQHTEADQLALLLEAAELAASALHDDAVIHSPARAC